MTVKHEISPLTSSSPKRVSSTKQVKKSASNLTTALESRIRRLAPIGLTAIWFLFLLLLIFLFNNYGNEFRPSPEVLAVFAIVFVGYLIFSGRVAEIGGAGWVVKLRNISQNTVSIQRIRESLNPSVRVDKGSLEHLKREIIPKLMSEPISTLSLKKGLGYDSHTLWEYLGYLKSLPTFHDVIFVDESGHFQGWIDPQVLLNLLNYIETRAPIEKLLNNWELAKIPGLITSWIAESSTNREALTKMNDERLSSLPVLDQNSQFVGTVKRETIIGQLLETLLTS